ncbi:MAG: sigma-70 family RNA polymerase sigma factor [Acidobacteria bacterium]|nr:sigma-70 family RNA polymerase sigma factor [Acidobacteriota bacterium]
MTRMTPAAEKIVDESLPRLCARAANPRGLGPDELRPRVVKAVGKYLLRDGANAGNSEIRSFIDELRADDLCLVLACERGDADAWDELVKNFDSTVRSAARKITNNIEDSEDLASSIWAELYGLKEGKGKLGYYSGRGSLGGWLRAVVAQLAVDQFRKVSRFVQIEEDREFENLAAESSEISGNSSAQSPEEILSERSMQNDVSQALKAGVSELEPEDKLIMKLYYYDDLKLKDIGAMLGFHEATASRKLVRIQSSIRKSVEKALREKHGWNESEVTKHLAETAEKLGLNFETMFAVLIIFAFVQEIVSAGVQ